jgi:hypothetical protein
MVLEADCVTYPGATHPRETLYQKMVETTWLTNMMIGKVKWEREEARQEDNGETTTMLDELQRRLSSLEMIVKLLVEVEKDKKRKE